MKIIDTLKCVLPMDYHLYFQRKKTRLLDTLGQAKYISIMAILQAINRRHVRIKRVSRTDKKIIWVGCFQPHGSNIGDHAQTLAIEKFFQKNFSDYQIIQFYRNEVGGFRWNKIVDSVSKDDLIFIHSSGDFGSRYHIFTDKDIAEEDIHKEGGFKRYSWHDMRKKVILSFPNNLVIQLPTTVYYEDNDRGRTTLKQDIAFYNNRNVTVLCREPASYAILSKNLNCKSRFFPDFVFYLKPALSIKTRKKALLILRTDNESRFTQEERDEIKKNIEKVIPDVLDKDIHKLPFPISDLIRENYINSIFRIYQSHKIVITDMMHGMIFAVITRTPCIALDDAIPHKISAYKDILGKSVKFAKKIDEIPRLIQEALSKPYVETDLSSHFEYFMTTILGG